MLCVRRFMLAMVLLPVWSALLAAGENSKHWERFRGPNGAGISDDKNTPVKFGPNENLIWKADLPGAGNSSPIVWGKQVFIHTTSGDGKLRGLICIDAGTGKIRWQKNIPGVPAKIRADSSFASSTPTTDGKAVYVAFWDGKNVVLKAYDFDGESLWTKELGVFNSQHGPGASPILYREMLIFANDMDKDDFTTKVPNDRPAILMALDKRTGKLVWETPRVAERACYSAPFFLRRAGQKAPDLVVTSTTAVTGYDVNTGTKLWEAKGWQGPFGKGPLRTVASPALVGDVLCICSGGDAGRYTIGLQLPGADTDQPKRVWENRKDFPYVPSPLANGEHFYFVNDAGLAGCYHARTGKRVWFERLSESGFYASPLLIDGKIYATNSSGDVYVFAAEPTFKVLARNQFGETVRATPAVADGKLYIRGDRHLFCVGKSR